MIKRYGTNVSPLQHTCYDVEVVCLHPVSGLLLSCFYIASLWLLRFLLGGRRREVFAPSSIYIWGQRPWQSRQIILLRQGFLHVHRLEYIYHHHHVVPQAWISLSLSRHFSLSFIATGRSSRPHPVSSHICWMYVQAGRPAFARPYVGVHKSTSFMSSSLLL